MSKEKITNLPKFAFLKGYGDNDELYGRRENSTYTLSSSIMLSSFFNTSSTDPLPICSCKRTIPKELWDVKGNRAKGKSKEAREINLAD